VTKVAGGVSNDLCSDWPSEWQDNCGNHNRLRRAHKRLRLAYEVPVSDEVGLFRVARIPVVISIIVSRFISGHT